jgi:hypothetical protein
LARWHTLLGRCSSDRQAESVAEFEKLTAKHSWLLQSTKLKDCGAGSPSETDNESSGSGKKDDDFYDGEYTRPRLLAGAGPSFVPAWHAMQC